jgi:hypothetical protein
MVSVTRGWRGTLTAHHHRTSSLECDERRMASMSSKITVVVRVDEAGTWLARLVESLDAQDLPYHEFEVVFLVPDPGSGVGRRLAELSKRRPNVRIAARRRDPATLAKEVSGEWVLDLGPGLSERMPVLFPQALSRLTDFGASQDCQVVLGRAVTTTGRVVDDLFVTDRPRLGGGVTSPAASNQVIVLRRDLAMTLSLDGKQDVAQALTAAERVGVLGAYPSMLTTPPQQATAGGSVRVEKCAVEWRHGRIAVAVSGAAEDSSGGEVLFGIRQQASGLEYWLPSSTTNCVDGTFSGTAEIDVRTTALGSPLGKGVWTVTVGVHGGARGRHVRSPLPPESLVAGVIDGILVVPTTVDAQFALDIGATRSGVLPRLSQADVDIVESVSGTLLTARLDRLAVDGDSRTSGSLHLDTFPLPAYLVTEEGRARIECFVSGLAGTSMLSAQFGSGKPEPTGLNLLISPTGIMTIIPTPDKPTSAPTTPAGAHPAARQPALAAQAPVVARLRRRVPAPIEPAVRSLARNKIAVRVYRALMTGRAVRR